MKRGRLPLTALRSFEAAGRNLSFSKAAAELFVSQAAVSRQIRELEHLLGQPLFARLHRRVELTDAGSRLLAQLTRSFDEIAGRLAEITATPATAELKVSVEPAFAGALLVPRLDRFRARHPEIDMLVDPDPHQIEFRKDEAEIAIRYSAGARSWPKVEARHLFDVSLTPVLTPELMASGPPLKSPVDLARHTLLHDANRDGWAQWFQAAGLPDLALQRGPIYADASLVMRATKLGHGVGLGDRAMERDELASGTLVRPFAVEAPCGAYWLVAQDFGSLSAPASQFAAWVMEEFGETPDASG